MDHNRRRPLGGDVEAHPFLDCLDFRLGHLARPLGTLGQQPIELGLVAHQLFKTISNGAESIDDDLGDSCFQVTVAASIGKLGFDGGTIATLQGTVDDQQVVDADPFLGVRVCRCSRLRDYPR